MSGTISLLGGVVLVRVCLQRSTTYLPNPGGLQAEPPDELGGVGGVRLRDSFIFHLIIFEFCNMDFYDLVKTDIEIDLTRVTQ